MAEKHTPSEEEQIRNLSSLLPTHNTSFDSSHNIPNLFSLRTTDERELRSSDELELRTSDEQRLRYDEVGSSSERCEAMPHSEEGAVGNSEMVCGAVCLSIPDSARSTHKQRQFEYTGIEQYRLWEQCGIRMHFPDHTTEASSTHSSRTSIHGTVSLLSVDHDDYIFPEGIELVSAVYNISAEQPFPEPVTVEIQHCVPLYRDDNALQLEMSFIIADTQHGPPYIFQELPGGEFKSGSSYGKIQCSHFSDIAIKIKWKFGYSIRLFAATYYPEKNRARFAVTKHLSAYISDVRKEFRNSVGHLTNEFSVEICRPSSAIGLEISPEPNWKITPLISPAEISVRSVLDHQPRTSVPQVTMKIDWEGDQNTTTKGCLIPVNVKGVQGTISFYLECSADSEVRDQTPQSWRRERPKIAQLVLIKYPVRGEEKEFRFLKRIHPKLTCAGALLGVPVSTVAGHLSPEDKCQEILTQWLQRGSEGYPVQWGSLVQLLLDVELREEARELERVLERWY